MKKIDLSTIKDCSHICCNGDYVLLFGMGLWIFRPDGTFVAKAKNVRWPHIVAFLPNERLMVGGGDRKYHYLSLADGVDIWSFPIINKMGPSIEGFAVSADGKVVYDACVDYNFKPHLVTIYPEEQRYVFSDVRKGLRHSRNIFLDENGVLCAMQWDLQYKKGVKRIGIREMKSISEQEEVVWRHRCTQNVQGDPRLSDGKYVIHSDFTVLNIETMEMFSLLEDKGDWNVMGGFSRCAYDSERNLLTVSDLDVHENLVVDCKERRMVARYSGYTEEAQYSGCLVGDEFWIGSPDGVVRKPFPLIEEMPKYDSPYWRSVRSQQREYGMQLEKEKKD